ncbi:MAG: hypothetical protein RIS41_423 [Actinomycetota bacterium]|jgi:glycolate oxidase
MSRSPVASLDERLAHEIGIERVRTGTVETTLYSHDASSMSGSTSLVCFPESTEHVQSIVRACRDHRRSFVVRGAGTGLAGGATPLDDAVVVSVIRMNRILSVDPVNRRAWVEPGVLNLDLTRGVSDHDPLFGLHFAPDPSSQQSCTIGGNVGNNSGGPHCLAEGVTTSHVLGVEVVLTDGTVVMLGGDESDHAGLDLRGAMVGSEGMFGVVTKICVRLTQNPPCVETMLFDYVDVADGAATVSAVIAAGMVPAALEMMDRLCIRAVEDYVQAGLPTDAGAVLLVEVTGSRHQVAHDTERIIEIARSHRCRTVRRAESEAERALLWKGRKTAFGAVARIKPNYYLHDTVVPRRRLPEVLEQIYRIVADHDLLVLNVFHAGDGNLHPLIVFDKREPGVMDRVHAAGELIVRASVAAGGVLSGEHGIGLEKRDYMPLMFDDDDLAAQAALRRAFDPLDLANPHKVLPSPSSCGDAAHVTDGMWI